MLPGARVLRPRISRTSCSRSVARFFPSTATNTWTLFAGLTDLPFCDEAETFAAGSPPFEASFRRLVGELVDLLKRMRNHSTAVFPYPPQPGPDLQEHARRWPPSSQRRAIACYPIAR
jgi:hypothetical protein